MNKKTNFITISTFYISALCGVVTGTFSFLTNFTLNKIFNRNKNI